MSDKPEHQTDSKPPPVDQSIPVLLLTLADTTWRMFTPPAVFVFGGIWADLHWHTKPWLSFISAILGLGVSVLLIKQQLRKVQ